MAQLYPDEHAQALAELRSCSWHVPEHTVAQLIGFDGDVQNLRAWVRKLKMSGMDIAAFNAYEDKTGGDRERWWIIGHLTPKDAGILTTVAEQRTITNILAHEATALRYGINDLSEDQAGAAAVQTWNEVLMDLVFTHPDVFHLRDMLQRFHSAPASRGRPTRRDIANAFTASLRGMLRRGVFSLPEVAAAAAAVSTPSLPAVSTPSTAVPGTPPRAESPPPAETPPPPPRPSTPSPTPRAMPEEQQTQDDRAQVPLEEQTVPRVIRLMETGRGWQPYSVQARIAVIIMTQMNVSQVNQPTLLKSLLELFGHTIDGPVLSRSAVQNIQAEAGVLANSAIAEKLLERGNGSLQSVTACIDAASIGEDKFESCAFTWKEDGKFVRVALPLLELATSDDSKKQAALESACSDVIRCYNACNAPENADEDIVPVMTMYSIARICGHTVNDHAESVVKNKFIPWAKALLEHLIEAKTSRLPLDIRRFAPSLNCPGRWLTCDVDAKVHRRRVRTHTPARARRTQQERRKGGLRGRAAGRASGNARASGLGSRRASPFCGAP